MSSVARIGRCFGQCSALRGALKNPIHCNQLFARKFSRMAQFGTTTTHNGHAATTQRCLHQPQQQPRPLTRSFVTSKKMLNEQQQPEPMMPFEEWRAARKGLNSTVTRSSILTALISIPTTSFTIAIPYHDWLATLPTMKDGVVESLAVNLGPEGNFLLFINGAPYDADILAATGCASFSIVVYFLANSLMRRTWALMNPEKAKAMQDREIDYFHRIQRLRSHEPQDSSNYYGDNVMNLEDYRKWVRTQNAITRGETNEDPSAF
eukprot:m.136990 g.136990  ORF g.136990 m.136990 type:complete len:264 (+) comp29897_c0_seq2:262-1053(+)